MKYLIKDTELMAYLEGGLSKEEVRSLKRKMEENGELNILYHLKLSYEEGMKEYADALIGEDDFAVDGETLGRSRVLFCGCGGNEDESGRKSAVLLPGVVFSGFYEF